jgi:rhamnogalacturonan endolyase
MIISLLILATLPEIRSKTSELQQVFLKCNADNSYQIGNDIWNLTINPAGFGKSLYYHNKDLVGNASGHYLSYSCVSPLFLFPRPT